MSNGPMETAIWGTGWIGNTSSINISLWSRTEAKVRPKVVIIMNDKAIADPRL